MHWGRACLAVALAAPGAAPQSAPAMRQWIEQALARNRDLLSSRQRIREAEAALRQAGVRPAPSLETTGGTGRLLGTEGVAEFTAAWVQPVETGGKRERRLEAARRAVEVAQAEYDERVREISFEVKRRYIDAAAQREKTGILDRVRASYGESHRLLEERVRHDDAAPLDVSLLAVEMARVESQRVLAAGTFEATVLELRRLAGTGGSVEALPEWRRGAARLNDWRTRALKLRPDLRAARALEAQLEAEVRSAESQGRPDLSLSAQYARRHGQVEDGPRVLRERDNVVTFGVSIPLFSGRRNAANVEAASARAAGARLRREQLEASVPIEVEAAWRRLEAARGALDVLQQGVFERAEKNLEVMRQAYTLGQWRLVDVIQEERRLLEGRLALVDARAEAARGAAELERVVGGDLQ